MPVIPQYSNVGCRTHWLNIETSIFQSHFDPLLKQMDVMCWSLLMDTWWMFTRFSTNSVANYWWRLMCLIQAYAKKPIYRNSIMSLCSIQYYAHFFNILAKSVSFWCSVYEVKGKLLVRVMKSLESLLIFFHMLGSGVGRLKN